MHEKSCANNPSVLDDRYRGETEITKKKDKKKNKEEKKKKKEGKDRVYLCVYSSCGFQGTYKSVVVHEAKCLFINHNHIPDYQRDS